MKEKSILILEYFKKIKSSHKELTKKEAFKDLLNRLYSHNKEVEKIIDKITLGAEATIINIPRKDKLHKGSADTLFNKIIIEFENDLKNTYKHAKEQLAGYLLGQFNTGEGYNFTLIASDFIHWKVLAPDISCLDKIETLNEDELILNEVESASFILNEDNCDEFYYWLDRFLFKEEKHRATLKRIEEAFGYQSNVFIDSFRELDKWFKEAKIFNAVQVSYEQWAKFLSIAYGSFEATDDIFLIHTYLSVFAKMLAFAVVSNKDFIDDDTMLEILDGRIFNKYNISNFVDNDFFHWVKDKRNFRNLKKVYRLIAQEISTFDFNNVDEDILKGVYQELIDLDTRHALGEYYTPDWLCERIVSEFEFTTSDKILDPACGSGSFLRAAIHQIRKNNPTVSIDNLIEQIYGIDIHPLSVQIAKTTVLLALGTDISKSRKPIHLNIILANTLLAPEGIKNLFGKEFYLQIDRDNYIIDIQILDDVKLFDEALDICDELSEQTINLKDITKENFQNILSKQNPKHEFNKKFIDSFYKIYLGLKKVKSNGRDGIWKFILSNLYKPYFLTGKFDYVIGNPPWFTYSSIKNEEYQDILNKIAEHYFVKPDKVANFPHLEIAAIFQAYCSSYYLKKNGKLAFVLPRSFFSADHHDNTRSGKAKGFNLTSIWDLEGVKPLFRIPSCVLFSEKSNAPTGISDSGLFGVTFRGNLPKQNCNYETAKTKLIEEQTTWFYSKLGKSTAFSMNKQEKQKKVNPYKSKFKQGATIVPRVFYFVELNQVLPPDYDERIINIKTADIIKPETKAPWIGLEFSNIIESRFIFRTALSRSILPFALYKPDLVVIPISINKNQKGLKTIKLYSPNELMNNGFLRASRWFTNIDNIWNIKRTEKNEKITSYDYLNWQNKLTSQKLNLPYLVLYNASAKDANATIVVRSEIDFEFIVESKTYVYYTSNLSEAYYITALLNSNLLNLKMKDFQTRGLFGPRDIHKKILDNYFPKYDDKNELHKKLAEISKNAHTKVSNYLKDNPPQQELKNSHLGRIRLEIKTHLKNEMKKIDEIVKKIIE